MFAIGDRVTHYKEGVCEVMEVGKLNLRYSDKDRQYYTLRPYYHQNGMVYIPVDGKQGQLRMIISKEEANELLQTIADINDLEIANEKQREAIYKEALYKNECKKWISLLKTSYKRKISRLKAGKKVINIDERYLNQVEKFLFGEIAVVLSLSKEEVKNTILAQINV